MADNYSKQLYDQLNSIDPSYGKDISFDKFQSSIKDKNYATQVYNQLSTIDPSYKKDVSFDKFYSSVKPQEKGFLSKAWENVTSGQGIFGKPQGTPIKQEYKPQPSLLGQWIDSFSPTEKEKKQVTTGLQTLAPQTKQPKLSPLEEQQKKVDNIVNPFKEFRKFVPDTESLYGPNGPITSDSLNVGKDVGFFYSIDQKTLQIQEGDKMLETKVADLKPNPYLSDYATLSERVSSFNKQKEDQIAALQAENLKKTSEIRQKYSDKYSDEDGVNNAGFGPAELSETKKINKEYKQKIAAVEKAYQNLKENVFDPLNTQITNADQLKYRGIKGESLDEEIKDLENSKVFTKNLNAQDKQARLRDAASSTIKSDVLGQDPNKLDEEYTKYDNPELAGNFITKSPLQKESKEYRGTVEQLAINRDITEGYTERRNNIAKALEEGKAKLQEDLQNNVYSKGYKITDLTLESQKRIQEQEADFKKLESLIKLYDENINLSKQREGILLNDVGSFTELINYRAEQDKINRLYIESPGTTFAYSFIREFGMKLGSFGETASALDILRQKKLGVISDVDADFYLKTIPEVSDRKVYVQKLVEDKETGQMVYKNLKDLESVSIFNEKGEYKPLGSWVENWDALGYQMLNTTAESAIIGFSGLAVRKGLYAAGRAATGNLAAEMGILEAIDASTVGLSNINKAKLLGLQGLKKSATWTADVTSMLPATTLLYSPETIKGEIDKGLSVEDVVLTSSLRLLAETASENLFFDDVKFVDNLLKSGTVKNFTELSRSEAYRILMDKVSIATAGRGLSELEFKTLFTGQGLKKLLTKENYEYLVKRALPQKAKSLGAGIAYGAESSLMESGEEVSTNAFNALIDGWRQSEDPKYKADQEFTLENQVNTVIQTMASMLLLGGKAGYQQAKEKASERRYNVDLAAYNVAITPNIFKENLYNQYLQSQKTDNPMSNDELSLRMKEIDRIAEVYNSLGFSEENTKQNIKTQLEKLTEGKTEVDDVLKNQLLKEAEREVRNTEFQAFRDGLTKSTLENQFLTAKTDAEKEKIAEEIDKTFEKIEQLKQQRAEQSDTFIQLQKQLSEKQYDEQRLMLSKAVQNVDSYVDSFETLNEIDEQLEILNSYENVTDETIKDYATVLSTALKNKQYELLEQGETRLTPEQIAEKEQFDLNNFSEAENNVIQSLGIKPEEISKKDGKIIYSYEGQPIEFDNFKGLYSFQQKKYQEKQEQIIKAERERAENEQIVELQKISDFPLYKTTTGKFVIDIPNEEPIEFDSIEELTDYVLNPKPAEDVQQDDLNLYEDEVENEYNIYKQGKKKPLSKERWLKTKAAQKSLAPLKQKYGIIDDTTIIEDDTLAVTFVPLKTEMSENEVSQINNIANIEHLSVPGITYENTRLVSVPHLISYQSRSFTEKVEIDEDTGNRYTIEESVNELNKEFEFIHSPKFAEGQEFTINIKPFETSEFTEAEKETLRKNAKYLIEQGISQEEINRDLENDEMFREIQIFDKEGKYVGAVHSLSYVRPDRVVAELTDDKNNIIPNLAPNYQALKTLRNKLLAASKDGKDVKLVLTAKSPGWLSIRVNSENKSLEEAFTNPESLGAITVLSKTSTLRIAGKETVNQGMQGSTVIPIITPNGNYFTLTLNKTKLHKLQVDNVLNAIQLYASYNKLIRIPSTELTDDDIKALKSINDLAENIQTATQHDIRKPDGVKNYIQLFVNANSKTSDYYTSAEKESLQNIPFMDVDTDSNGALRITFSNQRIFSAADPNLKPGEKAELKAKGIYRYTLQDLMEGVDFSILKEHLLNRTINHSTELIKSNTKFALPYLKKTNLPSNPYILYPETELNYEGLTNSYTNYKNFVISTSVTPVIETKLSDGTFSYFQQPNLAFGVDITEPKPEEPTTEEPEVTPTPEQKESEVPAATDAKPKVVTVYHHTNVAPQDFDFGSFQRGKQQVSQFGDGLNASSTTTPFLVQRYGNPIEGEINDSDFIVIDANKSEKELYEELKAKGYKFNNPDTGSYIGNDPAKEYDGAEKANVQPAIISLFNDFQKSNPQVKGVKVINHIIGNQKVDPFYVIYDAKSFYGPGSLSKTQSSVSTDAKADIEKEKASITNSEFTELKRLAKFFLENPKEPTVSGSVVTRYPALFKAVTDIEKRRQEELDRETPIKNENITVDFGGNISVTYQVITYKDGSIKISTTNKTSKKYNKLSDEVFKDYEKIDFESDAKGIIKTELIIDNYNDKQSQEIKEAKERTINAKYDAELKASEGKKEVTPEVIVSTEVADQISIENNNDTDETGFDEGLRQFEEFFGDQGDISSKRGEKDLALESKYFSEGRETTSTEILNKIAQSNHPLAPLAKKLLQFDPKVKIELVDDLIDGKYSGRYTLKNNQIKIAKNARFRGLGSEVTLLHEIIHAQTVLYISNNPDSQLVQDLEAALEKIREHKKDYPEDAYAFKDIYELVVGVFTDASAIKFLQSIPATKPQYKNLFVEFFEYIKNLFNFNKQESTLYDEVFAIGTNIISNQKDYTDFLRDITEFEEVETGDIEVKPAVEENLKTFFTQFGFQFKEGDSSTDLLQKIIYTSKEDDNIFIDNSVKALSQLLLANTNIDFNKLQDLIEETSEFKNLLKNSSEYVKNTHQYLKDGNRLPMEEWLSYIKEYNKIKNSVLEQYLKESLLDKNNSTGLHQLINDFLQFFKDLFSNATNLKQVTDSLIQQVLNNQKEVVINSQDLKNKERVTLAKALEETTHGKDIIKTFGEFGLILTGSVSAAEQGSVFRKVGKLLHDIDWVVPKGFTKDFNKKLKDTFTGATLVREFDSAAYYTQTYIVPPKGYTISNLTFFKPEVYGERKYIASYDVLDKNGNVVSNYRRYYDVKESGKVVENREVYNEGLQNVDKNLEAVSVDFFQNKEELKFKPYTVNVEGIELQLSNWMSSFTEKLKYGRAKDLLDYANFIPNDLISSEIKPGVEELFSSNPELANQVYEALGVDTAQLKEDIAVTNAFLTARQHEEAKRINSGEFDDTKLDLKTELQNIIDNSSNPLLVELAKSIQNKESLKTIKAFSTQKPFKTKEGFEPAAAYQAETQRLVLFLGNTARFENKEREYQYLLHELVHHFVDRELVLTNSKQAENIRQLFKYTKYQLTKAGKENLYGLTNFHEFITEALTNSDFQKELKNLQVPEQFFTKSFSLFDYFLELISKILGTNKSVLEAVVFQAADIFELQEYKKSLSITSQQKQQALQLYSQYLDTIFPDSEVKDIYQHSSNTDLQKEGFKKGFGKTSDAFFFDKISASPYAGKFKVKVLLNIINTFNRYNNSDKFIEAKYGTGTIANIQEGIDLERSGYIDNVSNQKAKDEYLNLNAEENPDSEGSQFIKKDTIEELQKYGNFDSIYAQGYLAVFEPEQIHILGSKQDIKGFKEFVGKGEVEKKQVEKTKENITFTSQKDLENLPEGKPC
jgi:hypothetical protein